MNDWQAIDFVYTVVCGPATACTELARVDGHNRVSIISTCKHRKHRCSWLLRWRAAAAVPSPLVDPRRLSSTLVAILLHSTGSVLVVFLGWVLSQHGNIPSTGPTTQSASGGKHSEKTLLDHSEHTVLPRDTIEQTLSHIVRCTRSVLAPSTHPHTRILQYTLRDASADRATHPAC